MSKSSMLQKDSFELHDTQKESLNILEDDWSIANSEDATAPSSKSGEQQQQHEALLEAQLPSSRPTDGQAISTKWLYLAVWLMLNLAMTLCNKAIVQVFPFPWLLTAVHSTSCTLGCTLLYFFKAFEMSRLAYSDHIRLLWFSLLFTMNIALSNVSLALVSIPFHQIMRATGPICTMLIYRVFFGRSYAVATYASSFLICCGVAMVSLGDYEFTLLGFTLTLLGVILAAVKGIVTNWLLTGRLALSTLELLFRLSPIAAIQCVGFAAATGELELFRQSYKKGEIPTFVYVMLAGNGCIAFALNFASLQTNKLLGALTLAIAGNLKQTLTVLLGAIMFNVVIGPIYAIGLVVALTGAAWYSRIEIQSRAISSN